MNSIARLKQLCAADLARELEAIILEAAHDIVEHDNFVSEMATTNATAWEVTDCRVQADSVKFADDAVTVSVSYMARGEQEADRPYAGTKIRGEAVAVIDHDGVSFADVTAEQDDERLSGPRSAWGRHDSSGSAPYLHLLVL